ncbi:hypothetical protein GR198_05825 [Rhizobium leguminosarum]|nr:hypothetical protein [Rhizobium leguminosarum]
MIAYLTRTLTAIVNGHKQSRIGELLPWNYSEHPRLKSAIPDVKEIAVPPAPIGPKERKLR